MKRFFKFISVMMVFVMLLIPVSITAQAATAANMKDKVVSVAQHEVGYTGTSTYSKYGEWLGYQGAWCTSFVLWCFNKAGNDLGVKLYGKVVPNGGNCNSMISWYKNRDRYHTRSSDYTPKKGDLIFFDWSGNGSSQHVGIVKSISGSTVYTIEGNCSGQVKERKYTTSGSKPYNNISAIMGYGSPDWGSVSNGKSETTKKQTTKKSTTKKATTQKATTKKNTTKKAETTKKTQATSSVESTTKKTQESATKESTASSNAIMAENMKLYAATTDLEIGDSVELDYSLEPVSSNAVVEYFCDEENIIDISNGGVITAVGEGTATVVVCANDEIYKQCDFKVREVTSSVTRHTGDYVGVEETTQEVITVKNKNQKLQEIGVNLDKIQSHKDYYIIPLSAAGATVVLAVLILVIKKFGASKKVKKSENNDLE